MLTRRFFYVLIATLTANFCVGQISSPNTGIEVARMQYTAKQVIPPSPEAAELGKYGNVPVSLFTGTPSISISLVELPGNFLSLPVSMSYNASGFKPEELAPWTGLGWALNAGGVITRSVLGEADVVANYFTTSPVPQPPLDPVPSSTNYEYDKQKYFSAIRNKTLETQPDVYYYNFMGHSGKFLIKPDGTIFKKEKNQLDISGWYRHTDDNTFTIKDEQGVAYEFWAQEKTHTYPIDDQFDAPPMIQRDFTSAWYLTRVVSPTGDEELIFEYDSPQNAQVIINNSVHNRSVSYWVIENGYPNSLIQNQGSSINVFQPPITSILKKFISKVTHKKNGVVTGYVEFESDANVREDYGDRLLKKVKLFSTANSVNTLVKQFEMGYEYFGSSQPTSELGYKRLKLKRIQELSTDGIALAKPPHEFFYKSENAEMPKRYSSGLDHWGFYNGEYNVWNNYYESLIPTVTGSYPLSVYSGTLGEGAIRTTNEAASSMTMIEKINYPTGGYTTFEFEGHDANIWPNNGTLNVGGVRIKKMIDYAWPDKPAIVKTFEYKKADGVTTSGYTGNLPRYDEYSTYETNTGCVGDYTKYIITITANSVFGLGSVQGSHIAYERVTERQTDFVTGQPLGKTVYNYNILGFSEVDDDLGNGDLDLKEVYDSGNKLLLSTKNNYDLTYGVTLTHRKLLTELAQSGRDMLCLEDNNIANYEYWNSNGSCVNMTAGYSAWLPVPVQYKADEHYTQFQSKVLTSQTQKIYDQASNSYLTTEKNYTYGNTLHTYPTLIEETSSNGEKVFTSLKYVMDYTRSCSGGGGGHGGMTPGTMVSNIMDMQFGNMPGFPVEKLQYRQDAGGNKRYLSGQITDYFRGQPKRIYLLQAQPLLSIVPASAISCNDFNMHANYKLAGTISYDVNNNIQEEQKTNDVITSYLWGYNKRYPVAKVIGKTQADAISQSGIVQSVLDNPSSEAALRTELDKLRSLSNAFATTYTYKAGVGVASETDARGRTVYYEYDSYNRLVLVRDNDYKILKKLCYNYSGQQEDCTIACNGNNSNPVWQNSGSPQCQLSNGANTGYQLQQQININPCSAATPQLINIGYNVTACPLPPPPTCTNCSGADKKCINGICETGTLKIISTRRVKIITDDGQGNLGWYWQYYCTTVYCFSDATTSTPVESTASGFCTVQICQ